MNQNTAFVILAVTLIAACASMVITNHFVEALISGFGAWICMVNVGGNDA